MLPTHQSDVPKNRVTAYIPTAAGLKICVLRYTRIYFERVANTAPKEIERMEVKSVPGAMTKKRIKAVIIEDSNWTGSLNNLAKM